MLGGKRNPSAVQNGPDPLPDISANGLSIEYKDRSKLPKIWRTALAQAHGAKKDGELAVAIWHERGRVHTSDIVMMFLDDFRERFNVR